MHRETELFLSCLEKFPCLWNISHEDYNNRRVKDKAWDSINSKLYPDWYDICENEKKVRAADTKRKWTNIRYCYRREHTRMKFLSPEAASKHKRYIYSDILSFMDPVFNIPRYYDGNSTVNEDTQSSSIEEEPEDQDFEDRLVEIFVKPQTDGKHNRIDVHNEDLHLYQTRRKGNKRRQTFDDDDDDDDGEDDDTQYLLSFRSYMKKMNSREKIDFKIGILELVKKKMRSVTANSVS